MVFISFPPGTIGHPADKDVILRLANVDGSEQRDLVHLFGGQGTINVPSWSPDSTKFAFVDYPIA
jgi:Tol biopolymer transport system component